MEFKKGFILIFISVFIFSIFSVTSSAESEFPEELKGELSDIFLNAWETLLSYYEGIGNYGNVADLGEYESHCFNVSVWEGEFADFEDYKNALLECVSPIFAMDILGCDYSLMLNFKGTLAGFSVSHQARIDSAEPVLIYSDEERILFIDRETSTEFEVVLIDGKWVISRDGAYRLGLSSEYSEDDDYTEIFSEYIENVLWGYFLSENAECGYAKYLIEDYSPKDILGTVVAPNEKSHWHKVQYDNLINILSFDPKTCTGSASIVIDEYDPDGKVQAQREITVIIEEGLSEKICVDGIEVNPQTSDLNPLFYILSAVAIFGISSLFFKWRDHSKE